MQKFFLFALSGGMVYIINIGFTFAQTQFLGFGADIAYLISLLISMAFGLFFSFTYTFQTKLSRAVLKKYLLALTVLSLLNYILVQFLTQQVSQDLFYIFIFFATTIIFFLKFFVYDRFVFTRNT